MSDTVSYDQYISVTTCPPCSLPLCSSLHHLTALLHSRATQYAHSQNHCAGNASNTFSSPFCPGTQPCNHLLPSPVTINYSMCPA